MMTYQKIIFTLSEDIENEIISKLQRSIELGKTLDPKFLEFLEKDLPQQFSNNLIGGMEKYLQGFQSENATLQLEGNNLNMAWNQYWQRNKEVILDKMYPNN
jgi:hypothetical protein